jgi:hypothetical protein
MKVFTRRGIARILVFAKTLKYGGTMPLEDLIIRVYLQVSDFFDYSLGGKRLRACGSSPNLSDQEVLTMEIIGEYLGLGLDKRIWDYFKKHWLSWFPKMGSRTSFTRQIANLLAVKSQMFQLLSEQLTEGKNLYLFDGFPIPICHIKRYKRSRSLLKEEGAVGYCAAKDEKYYGFKGHLLVAQNGVIKGFELTAANIDERDVLPELAIGITGDIIADKGLIRPSLRAQLKAGGIVLHTPLRNNMKEVRPKSFVNQIMNIRRRIESVIAQLVDRFSIQRIRAKDLWHLKAKIMRKLLAHTTLFSINSFFHPEAPLQFEVLSTR